MTFAAHDGAVGLEFGVNLRSVESGEALRTFGRRCEALGFDVVAAPDHIGGMAPFSALVAIGFCTGRARLRTYVLNAGFWNPALLAREVATADVLTGGRFELGIGAGHMRREHDDAGLPWHPHGERVEHVARVVGEVRRRLAAPGMAPPPVQDPVPVMVGGMSRRALELAAEVADVVGLAGVVQARGRSAGTFRFATTEQADQQVAAIRHRLDGRSHRVDLLLQAVVLGPDPERAAHDAVAATDGLITTEEAMETPFALFATDARAAALELERRRVRFGVTSVTTHQPSMEALGAVLAAHRALHSAPPPNRS